MRKTILFYCVSLLILLSGCNKKADDKEFNVILNSLSKNYAAQGPYNQFTAICWKVDQVTFKKDSVEYSKGLHFFHQQELPFIRFLLQNKKETNEYSNWIQKKNPCSSFIQEEDYTNNKKGTLILIDNLFCQHGDAIVIAEYIDKIKIDDLNKMILEEGRDKDFNELRSDYLNYIDKIK